MTTAYLGISMADWIKALQSEDAIERRLAAHALGELGASAQAAAPELLAALHDPHSFVRVWAAAALARVEPSRPEALETLMAAFHDETQFVRSLAIWHLGRLGCALPGVERALPSLRGMVDDANASVCTEACLALKRLEGKGAPPPELQSLTRGA
ncbi:MAG: HEAT repeat domain-containing protein [Gemmataceae bacterium]|nr:HEAT repeat domain-containing protein [Gemmataceae bacterium]